MATLPSKPNDKEPIKKSISQKKKEEVDAQIDEALKETFPASDPPAYSSRRPRK